MVGDLRRARREQRDSGVRRARLPRQRLCHGHRRPGGGRRQRQPLYAHGHGEVQRGRRPGVDDRLDRRRLGQRRSGGQRRQHPVRAGLRRHRALPTDRPRRRRAAAPAAAARRGTGRADERDRELEHPRQDSPHVDQHRHQCDVDHRTALQREHVHGVCRRRPARRHGDVLDRRRGEVALDVSLSDVRGQRCGTVAVLEHRERDGALSTETKAGPQGPALVISEQVHPTGAETRSDRSRSPGVIISGFPKRHHLQDDATEDRAIAAPRR